MKISRRAFLASSAAGVAAMPAASHAVGPLPAGEALAETESMGPRETRPSEVRVARDARADPWLDVDRGALAHNIAAISRRVGGRRIIVVAKNNAYGLGARLVGPALDGSAAVWGFAVVRAEEALALREAGVRKPILLMGPPDDDSLEALVRSNIRVAAFGDDVGERLARASRATRRPVGVHLYIDTGMGRMGMPFHRAMPWISSLVARKELRIEGACTELTEDAPFDAEQVERLRSLAADARRGGVEMQMLHAASSAAIMHQPDTLLDTVRPGLAVYGGYVSEEARARGELRPAYSLRARVIRVEQLRPGDGVSYHRRYVAQRPTWIALLPVGHVDGYPSRAVDGCEVLIGGRLFRVIGTVSASHTIVEVGDDPVVKVGDIATLVGGESPAIHPNEVAKRSKSSEYDIFMHLSPSLPRRLAPEG